MIARPIRSLLLGAPVAAALLAHAAPAHACGGFSCDGPTGMAVDQSGENILFAFTGNSVEVHIQVQYDPNTEASKFAWLIPVQSLPEFHVGSQVLFDNVLNGTVPFYGVNTTTEVCGEGGGGDSGGAPNDGGLSGSATGATSDGEGGGGPDVVYQKQVGAFEITVLKGGTATEVMDWLGANGYQQPADAEPILDEYIKEGNLVAALKLIPTAEPVVHPIVLVYDGVEPCVPIRLTRIAAVEDMDIRVFFLGDHRAIPTNYRHVLVNPLKIDWPNFAANYKEVVTAAVDAFKAEGNAFVTEYAGPSNVISQGGLLGDLWDAKAYVGLPVIDVGNTLMAQGLMTCDEYSYECWYNHPLVEGLVQSYITIPNGVTPYDFWTCMSCYEAMIDAVPWGDGSEFAAGLVDRVIEPGQRALGLLQTKPYITRMYTTISPHEMMADPVFAENPDLPEIAANRQAQKLLRCDGHAEYTLPDGREVFVPNDGPWPDFPGEMPWEEETSQMAMAGAPQILVTNTQQIDQILADWNAKNRPDYSGLGADSDGTSEPAAGCGCRSDAGAGGAALALGVLGLAGLGRRRRR